MRHNKIRFALTMTSLIFGLTMLTSLNPRSVQSASAPATNDRISLLQTLAEWKYPDSQHIGELSMSDAVIPPMRAVKCEGILTTRDPFEKVTAFYKEKLKPIDSNPITLIDDSQGRAIKLQIIVVNRLDTSTTLAISQAPEEKETHIGWSHYIRIARE